MTRKSKGSNTNTYAYQSRPDTAAETEYRTAAREAYNTPDPNIGFQFGAQRQRLEDRFDNPWGPNVSPEVQEAARYAGNQSLDQQQGLAMRGDANMRREGKVGALAVGAGLNAPQLVQTGGTFTQQTREPWGPAAIGAAGTVAGGFLS